MSDQLPRRFHLVRDIDETGTSGVGVVVEGLEFTDGTVALRWLTATTSTAIYDSIEDVKIIHGHGGKTRVVWVEDQMTAGLTALIAGKNAELKQHHLAARIGDLQGSRVQAVRDVLDGWAPQEGAQLQALWTQVKQATELYESEIARIRQESHPCIPGVTDPDDREEQS